MRHLLAVLLSAFLLAGCSDKKGGDGPIKVGVLHSLTGTMEVSGKSVRDATVLAIDELNEKGGVLGRRLEAVVVDGKSDDAVFTREAERLITEERVSVVFGCWRSSERKSVLPIFEARNHLLIYPVQFEALEETRNIVYLGATPNQQIVPAVKWCMDNVGKRFFLVGSDYVFPRTANAIIRDMVNALKGEIAGEEYVKNDGSNAKEVVAKVIAGKPAVILNTINGSSNKAFFRELRAAGVTPKSIPTMSFSVAEEELRALDVADMEGDYAAWNYFQSIDTPENRAFIARFQAKHGKDRAIGDPMEAAYFGVHLWAQAATDAGTDAPNEVVRQFPAQSMKAPEGIVAIDPFNLETWKTVRVGRIRKDGQFDIVWSSSKAARPVTYPVLRTRQQWIEFLNQLQKGWGGRWANPNG
ncbi:MAG: urea ABC transporter substrate-binding protein [Planctomycetota bacterium]